MDKLYDIMAYTDYAIEKALERVYARIEESCEREFDAINARNILDMYMLTGSVVQNAILAYDAQKNILLNHEGVAQWKELEGEYPAIWGTHKYQYLQNAHTSKKP